MFRGRWYVSGRGEGCQIIIGVSLINSGQRLLQRHLEAECLSAEAFSEMLLPEISSSRSSQLLDGAEGTIGELRHMARVLSVKASDLTIEPMAVDDEVCYEGISDSLFRARASG